MIDFSYTDGATIRTAEAKIPGGGIQGRRFLAGYRRRASSRRLSPGRDESCRDFRRCRIVSRRIPSKP
jgi:hypothetical protein